MSNTTKSVDTSGVPSTIQEITSTDSVYANGGANRGVFNDTILEAVPKYIRSAAEEVISKGNSHIVLGRDRPASRASGYGRS